MRVRRRVRTRKAIWFAAGVVSLGSAARADTASWLNAVNGNWTDATKWSTNPSYPNNGSPSPVYDVVVDATGAPYTITLNTPLNAPVTVNSLKLDSAAASLQSQVASLHVLGSFDIAAGSFLLDRSVLQAGSISGGSNAVFQVAGYTAMDSGSIGANVQLLNSAVLRALNGSINLSNGRISYSGVSGSESSVVVYGATPTLSGFGEIIFDGTARNWLKPDGARLNIGAGVTVRTGTGSGLIGGDFISEGFINYGTISVQTAGQSIDLHQPWSNKGILRLSDGALKLGSSFAVADIGTVQRSGGTLLITGNLNNGGTNFTVDNSIGSVGLSLGGTITGGTVTSNSGNRLSVEGFGVLDGVTLALDAPLAVNGSLHLHNAVTLAGNRQIDLVSAVQPAQNSQVALLDGASLIGPGEITFDAPTQTSVVIGPSIGAATLGADITIQTGVGSGEFNGNVKGLTNQGLIWAKTAGKFIQMTNNWANSGTMRVTAGDLILGGNWRNDGSITASGGTLDLGGVSSGLGSISVSNAKLAIAGAFTTAQIKSIQFSGAQVAVSKGGLVDNSGDSIDLDATKASWSLEGGGGIKNGAINTSDGSALLASAGSSTLENVFLNTDLSLSNGATVTLLNPPDSTGRKITLDNSNLLTSLVLTVPTGQTTLNGAGEIIFNGKANNVVRASSGSMTVGANYLVRTGSGSGTVGSTALTTVNQGRIVAQTPGAVLTVTGASVSNQGSLEARNGGTVKVVNLSGELGNFVLDGGTLDLAGTYTLAQPINVGPSSALTLRGTWTNNGGITVDGGRLNVATIPTSLGSLTLTNEPTLGILGTFTVAQLQTLPYTAFSNIYFTGVAISGGTLEGAGIKNFIVTPASIGSNTILNGITLNLNTLVQPGAALGFLNGVSINKTVTVQSDSPNLVGRMLAFSPGSTLNGTGEIVFDGPGPGVIEPGTVTVTFGPNLTLRTGTGSGKLGTVSGTFINQGVISAQTPGESIIIAQSLTNTGQIQAINGSSITVTNTLGILNNGSITIGAGSSYNARGPLMNSNIGTIGGAGALHGFANSTIAGTQKWLSGAAMIAEANTITLNSNTGKAATATDSAIANLNVSIVGNGARIALGADQDLKSLDVQFANPGNQSLDLQSGATSGAYRSVRVYADDLAAARSAIYSAIVSANRPGLILSDGIFDGSLGRHPNARLGLATVLDGHGDAHLLIRPTRIGDLNLDGAVTIADFLELAAHFGSTDAVWEEGDLNYDRNVSIADFLDLAANVGSTYTGDAMPISASDAAMMADFRAVHVPEPAEIGMMMIAVSMLRRRRRRDFGS